MDHAHLHGWLMRNGRERSRLRVPYLHVQKTQRYYKGGWSEDRRIGTRHGQAEQMGKNYPRVLLCMCDSHYQGRCLVGPLLKLHSRRVREQTTEAGTATKSNARAKRKRLRFRFSFFQEP